MIKKKRSPPADRQFTVRMRETVERVYTVEASSIEEARAKAEEYDSELSHEDGVSDFEVVSVTDDAHD